PLAQHTQLDRHRQELRFASPQRRSEQRKALRRVHRAQTALLKASLLHVIQPRRQPRRPRGRVNPQPPRQALPRQTLGAASARPGTHSPPLSPLGPADPSAPMTDENNTKKSKPAPRVSASKWHAPPTFGVSTRAKRSALCPDSPPSSRTPAACTTPRSGK